MKRKYFIENRGCDDQTKLEIELNEEEFNTFCEIANKLNSKSEYRCQPKIAIFKYEECEIEEDEDGKYIYSYNAKNLLEG